MSFYGMMYVASASPKVAPGNIVYNSRSITEALNAVPKHARVIVFPQLALTSTSCGEKFFSAELHQAVVDGLFDIAETTKDRNTIIVIGAPIENSGKLYNCAVVLYQGKILAIIPKTYIDGYRRTEESKYFTSGDLCDSEFIRLRGEDIPFGSDIILNCNNYNNFKIACELGCDIDVPQSPSIDYALAGATVICGLASSYASVALSDSKCREIQSVSSKLKCAYIYAAPGLGEETGVLANDGRKIICECGEVLNTSAYGKNCIINMIDIQRITGERSHCSAFYTKKSAKKYREIDFDIELENYDIAKYQDQKPFLSGLNLGEIIDFQAHLLYSRMEKLKSDKVVLHLKGDMNSALALIVCYRMCTIYSKPYDNIIAVAAENYGEDGSLSKVCADLAEQFDINLKTYPAEEKTVAADGSIIKSKANYMQFATVYPALMLDKVAALSANNNAMIIGTSDLTDIVLGVHDFCGNTRYAYNLNYTLPKTVIKALVEQYVESCENEAEKDLLNTVLKIYKDKYRITNSMDDTVESSALIDYIAYYYLKYGFTKEKIHDMMVRAFYNNYSHKDVNKALDLFFKRFKGYQYMRHTVASGAKILELDLSARGNTYI